MKTLITLALLLLATSTYSPPVCNYRYRVEVYGRVYQSDSVWVVTGKRYTTTHWIGTDGIWYGIKKIK